MDGPGRGWGGPWAIGDRRREGAAAAGVVGALGWAHAVAPRVGAWQRARVRSVDHVTRALAHAGAGGLVDASALSGR